MGAAHDRVVLPAVAVELFPQPQIGVEDVLDPAHRGAAPCRVAVATSFRRTPRSRSRHNAHVITMRTANPPRAIKAMSGAKLGEGGCVPALSRNAFKSACSPTVRGWES